MIAMMQAQLKNDNNGMNSNIHNNNDDDEFELPQTDLQALDSSPEGEKEEKK